MFQPGRQERSAWFSRRVGHVPRILSSNLVKTRNPIDQGRSIGKNSACREVASNRALTRKPPRRRSRKGSTAQRERPRDRRLDAAKLMRRERQAVLQETQDRAATRVRFHETNAGRVQLVFIFQLANRHPLHLVASPWKPTWTCRGRDDRYIPGGRAAQALGRCWRVAQPVPTVQQTCGP